MVENMGKNNKFLVIFTLMGICFSALIIASDLFFPKDKLNYTCDDIFGDVEKIFGEPTIIDNDTYDVNQITEVIQNNTIFPDNLECEKKPLFLF